MPEKDTRLEKLTLELFQRETSLVLAEFLVCVLATTTSILGNVFVLFALYRNPRLRKPSNFYIISLTMSDITLALAGMTLVCVTSFAGRWIFGPTLLDSSVCCYNVGDRVFGQHGAHCRK